MEKERGCETERGGKGVIRNSGGAVRRKRGGVRRKRGGGETDKGEGVRRNGRGVTTKTEWGEGSWQPVSCTGSGGRMAWSGDR